MGIEHTSRLVVFNDTSANVEAETAALGEAVFGRDTATGNVGYSIDGGANWTWIKSGLVLNKLDATTAPAVTDDSGDGYSIGSTWIDVTADKVYIAVDVTVGAAVWKEAGGGGASAFTDLTDVPADYTGDGGKFVRVNTGETALEFAAIAGGGDVLGPATSADGHLAVWDGTDSKTLKDGGAVPGGGSGVVDISLCNGRLTLETGVPVSTTDQTAKTTLYFTPYKGNRISLYDGSSAWETKTFTELSLDISGYTADKNYDIWAYNNSGAVALDSTIWTDDTTRATALAMQDGVLVKTGATTRRYLGTIRITGTTGQCEDSVEKRFVWNMYNKEPRRLYQADGTSGFWEYNTNTWRAAHNDATNIVKFVTGQSELVTFTYACTISLGNGEAGGVGVGLDATNANSAQFWHEGYFLGNTIQVQATANYSGYLTGFHYLSMIEKSSAGTPQYSGYLFSSAQGNLLA